MATFPRLAAYIGAGNMGAPLAISVARAGIETRSIDKRQDRLDHVAENGVKPFSSLATGVEGADLVAIAVMADRDLEALLDEGLLRLIQPGATLLIHSTVHPALCRRVAQDAAKNSIEVLDACVSGSIAAAYKGEISVMVGGPKPLFEKCRPIFEAIGKSVTHVGEVVGSGAIAKIINNQIGVCCMTALLEGVRIAEESGVSADAIVPVLNASSGMSFWSQHWGGAEGFVRGHPLGEDVIEAMIVKDLNLSVALAEEAGSSANMAKTAAASIPKVLRDRLARTAEQPVGAW